MAGSEILVPPMSSDPTARLWAQVKALQQRVSSLEARRDVIYRGSGGLTGDGAEVTFRRFTFSCSGRPLLFHWGPSFDFCARGDIDTPTFRTIQFDLFTPVPHTVTTQAKNMSPVYAIMPAPAVTIVYDDIPAGTWTGQVSGTENFRSSYLILELPA